MPCTRVRVALIDKSKSALQLLLAHADSPVGGFVGTMTEAHFHHETRIKPYPLRIRLLSYCDAKHALSATSGMFSTAGTRRI